MKRPILVLILMLSASADVFAQSGLDRAKAALPAEAGRSLEQTVATARARGLPTAPLVDKALEGIAKHAPANVILEVVRQRLALLVRADAALRPFGLATDGSVTAVADVLQRGVSDDVVKRVSASSRTGEPIDLALHTLADLLERGVPVDVAFEMLSSWRARGANAEELRQMPAALERLVGEGASPASAGQAIAASVRSGKAVGAAVAPRSKPDVTKPGKARVGAPVPPGTGPPANRGRKDKS
jgi:hypothetical protein